MRPTLWNILTIVILVAGGVLLTVYMAIFLNPSISINPFPPPTAIPALVLPTATPTLRALPPTWTPTSLNGFADAAATLQASSTALPTSTGFVLPSFTNTATFTNTPTETPTITPTPTRTFTPSRTPTLRPTRTHTPAPPTAEPTAAPPTDVPTEVPTEVPPPPEATP